MRRYDLKTTAGEILWKKTGDEVEELYRLGRINQATMCRIAGRAEWHELNEHFPVLKYAVARVQSVQVLQGSPARQSLSYDADDRGRPAMTSALKAGWICFALGLAIAWLFPFAHFFFSVATILAIVAMSAHQVKHGVILLVSTFAGCGLSAAIFFALAVGSAAKIAGPILEQQEKERRELKAKIEQSADAMSRALGRISESVSQPARQRKDAGVPGVVPPRIRPVQKWNASELLAEITRLEELQRTSRKAGREVPRGTLDKLNQAQAAYDALTVRGGGPAPPSGEP